jgi:DEAD/DEAH box helicase domain-containing protein
VYDKFQGGIGLSKKLFAIDRAVLSAVQTHIQSCACKDGCPSCTGPTLEGGLFGKSSALKILGMLNLEMD